MNDDIKILYVPGLNEKYEIYANIKSYFTKTYTGIFDLLNYDNTLEKIKNLCDEYNVDLVIGSGLGAFYVLSLGDIYKKIIINPVIYPSKCHIILYPENLKIFQNVEKNLYSDLELYDKLSTYGIFYENDNMYLYYDWFKKVYNLDYNYLTHPISNKNNLIGSINYALTYFEGIEDTIKISNNQIFSELNESYQNIIYKIIDNEKIVIDTRNKSKITKYSDICYQMLEKMYSKIGGLLGLSSKKDLILETNFWKIQKRNGKPVAVNFYYFDDFGNRKAKYGCSDGTDIGKSELIKMMIDDMRLVDRQAWYEVSGAPKHILEKIAPNNKINSQIIKDYFLNKKNIIILPDDDYNYMRKIAGIDIIKTAFGNIIIK